MVRAEQDHAGPDGAVWDPNSTTEPPVGGYKGWKERKYGWDDEPNRRTNQMLSQTSLFGDKTRIEKHLVTLRYGTDQPPSRSASPNGFISDADRKVTDTQKAEWAHTGGKHGHVRGFYGAGDGDAEALCEVAQENLNDYIRESPYGRG